MGAVHIDRLLLSGRIQCSTSEKREIVNLKEMKGDDLSATSFALVSC